MDNREEQIRLAERLIATGIDGELKKAIENQFPELKESEDEKISKALLWCLETIEGELGIKTFDGGVSIGELKTYIEKQKEQKSTEWSEVDKLHQNNIITYLNFRKDKNLPEDTKYPVLDAWIDWLKSLRPQPHWKPSEKQIGALEQWLQDKRYDGDSRYVYPILESLYNDLQKLL